MPTFIPVLAQIVLDKAILHFRTSVQIITAKTGLLGSFALLMTSPCAAQTISPQPIIVATISSLYGSESTSEGIGGARAYFETINAVGGIRGRPIQYLVLDDGGDAGRSKKHLQSLVSNNRVVALVGGSSDVECGVNAESLARVDLYNLPSGAVEAACYNASHILPTNAGPHTSLYNGLFFSRNALKKEILCAVHFGTEGVDDDFSPVLAKWHRNQGGIAPKVFRYDSAVTMKAIANSAAIQRCDALVFVGTEESGIDWVMALSPLRKEIPLVLMTPSYSQRTAQALGGTGKQIYTMAEFDPWSSSLQVANWRQLMISKKLPVSSLSQGGYVAAQLLVKQMLSIDGPITRNSVSDALRKMPEWDSGMTHTPLRVDSAGNHEFNRSALPMKLEAGRWRIAYPTWISMPR